MVATYPMYFNRIAHYLWFIVTFSPHDVLATLSYVNHILFLNHS